jgi:AraC-like DNA-binding protein
MIRIRRENIQPNPNSSFRILVTPHLEEVFLWHYHPEYELVYLEGTDGNRHIGEHLERYEGSDLAFIRPNIPHLNFDYGANRKHTKIVVQLRADFMGADFLNKPELMGIRQLFDQPEGAMYFTGNTKALIGERLKKLPEASHFEQLIILLEAFQILSATPEQVPIQAKPIESQQDFRDQQRLKKVQQHVAEHFSDPIAMDTIVGLTGLSTAAFCRYFKKNTGYTFTEYLTEYRIGQARNMLLTNSSVTDACFGSGFENLSYFNRTFKRLTGENPLAFKKRWRS